MVEQTSNSVDIPPESSEYWSKMDTLAFSLTVLAIVCTVVIVVLGVIALRACFLHLANIQRRRLMLWITCTFPVVAVCSCIGLCVPRTLLTIEVYSLIYFCTALIAFTQLVQHLFDGREQMSATLLDSGKLIVLKTPPCCCCVCFGSPKPNSANLRAVESLVLQAVLLRALELFVTNVIKTDKGGDVDMRVYESIAQVVIILSTITALYGCKLFSNLASEHLAKYNIAAMMCILQCMLLAINLQGAIFGLLGEHGVFPKNDLMGPEYTAKQYHYFLLIVEILVLFALLMAKFRPNTNPLFDLARSNQEYEEHHHMHEGGQPRSP